MSEDQPVTVDQVRASGLRLVSHLNLGDCHVSVRQFVDFPRLLVRDVVPKNRRSKAKPGRTFLIGVAQFDTLVAAVDALNASGEADDD